MPWSSLPWCCLVAVFGIGLGNLPECQSPNDVATRTFRQLLGDFGTEELYWREAPTRPIVLRQLGRSFSHLFTEQDLEHLFNQSQKRTGGAADYKRRLRPQARFKYPQDVLACRTPHPGGRQDYIQEDPSADGAKLKELYGEGWTIVLQHPFEFFSPIYELAAHLEQHLLMMVSMYLFITPPGSMGFDFHSDSTQLLTLQIRGSKKWRVYPPFIESPMRGVGHDRVTLKDLPEELQNNVTEYVLTEGDVLSLPHGWHHTAEAIGTEPAVNLAILLEHVTWREVLTKLSVKADQMSYAPDSILEEFATESVDLPFRRTIPHMMHNLPDFALVGGLKGVLEEKAGEWPAQLQTASLEQDVSEWRRDFLANLTEDVLPPIGWIMPERRDRPLSQMSAKEVASMEINLDSELQVVSTHAARVTGRVQKGTRGKMTVVKYSTLNPLIRHSRKMPNTWLVPQKSVPGLQQILHVELNPSGQFTPRSIVGVSEDTQLQLARELLQRRIAIPRQVWLDVWSKEVCRQFA